MKIKIEVIETRTYTVIYTIEASNKQKALDKVIIGDTLNEEEIRLESVIDRNIVGIK